MFGSEIEAMEARDVPEGVRDAHVPVLVGAVVEVFAGLAESLRDGWIVDGTAGLGGHSAALLEALPSIHVLAVDRDPHALEHARARLAPFGARARVRRASFCELSRLVRKERIASPVGFLFDLGVSSMQLDRPERGFSFQHDGPLDMRMDPSLDRTAAEIVNHWDEADLADLFYYEGGETRARVYARAIVQGRAQAPFLRTAALADVVARAGGKSAQSRVHPATRVFQALRRAVNGEGEELICALATAEHWLCDGGRAALISFHSGEDGEIKRFFAAGARDRRFRALGKKPVEPERAEIRANPRSRSAKLRAAERMRPAGESVGETSVDPVAGGEA